MEISILTESKIKFVDSYTLSITNKEESLWKCLENCCMENQTSIYKTYIRLFLMITVSMIVMYGITYLNSYRLEDVFWSETRFYMNLIMGSAMTLVMLWFMRDMYKSKVLNTLIVILAIAVMGKATWLMRTQKEVNDIAYMKAMIPHHSIAILTSQRAQLKDIRVHQLAVNIAETQKEEIKKMKKLIRQIQTEGPQKLEDLTNNKITQNL